MASTFSSLNFLFFESEVSLARGFIFFFFKSLMRAYLSLLYLVAISIKKKKVIPN